MKLHPQEFQMLNEHHWEAWRQAEELAQVQQAEQQQQEA